MGLRRSGLFVLRAIDAALNGVLFVTYAQVQTGAPCLQRERQAVRPIHEEWDKDHGRREHRTSENTTGLNQFLQQQLDWSSLQQVFRITRDAATGALQRSTEIVYVITSLSRAPADARHLLVYNRGHGSIENQLRHVRDATFAENRCPIHIGHGAPRWRSRGTPSSPDVD